MIPIDVNSGIVFIESQKGQISGQWIQSCLQQFLGKKSPEAVFQNSLPLAILVKNIYCSLKRLT